MGMSHQALDLGDDLIHGGECLPLQIGVEGDGAAERTQTADRRVQIVERLAVGDLTGDLAAEAAELHRFVYDQGAVGLLDGLHDGLGVQGH